jgi:mannose-6-phosphate isomerase-like protein (cupin superfamily)
VNDKQGGIVARPGRAVNIASKFEKVTELWSPRIVAEFSDLHIKMARGRGEFGWHTHEDTDEVFLIHRGSVEIQMRDEPSVHLAAGDLYVVPAGVEHRPVVTDECEILLIEPANTPNTGNRATAAEEEWI